MWPIESHAHPISLGEIDFSEEFDGCHPVHPADINHHLRSGYSKYPRIYKTDRKLTFSPTLCGGALDLGVEVSAPRLMLLEASDSPPLLGVGEESRFVDPPFAFLEARGLEVVLREVWVAEGGFILTAPAGISPSDLRLLAVAADSSMESSLRVLLGLDLELEICMGIETRKYENEICYHRYVYVNNLVHRALHTARTTTEADRV